MSILRTILFAFVSLFASKSLAESHRFNLHVTPGLLLSPPGVAFDLGIGADWQFTRGIALDARLGLLFLITDFGPVPGFNPEIGIRFRAIDDHQGYANEPEGNFAGNLYIAPHLGLLFALGFGVSIDTEVGYEFSVAKNFQIGPYLRPMIAIGTFPVLVSATIGVTGSFGFGPEIGVDSDSDGVSDAQDQCPETPPDTRVDSNGCTIIPKIMVLEGIRFRVNSADIEPSSEYALKRSFSALRDNPKVSVEIHGHTDDTGTAERNQTLSLERAGAVADWLVAHGISARRLKTRGYGSSRPVKPNADEASRAINRRIEFERQD